MGPWSAFRVPHGQVHRTQSPSLSRPGSKSFFRLRIDERYVDEAYRLWLA
jgi:hypothetical protein